MTSNWALPTSITQYSEEGAELFHVSWDETENFAAIKNKDGKSIKTSRDLFHIARDPKKDITEKTYFLKLTGYNFINLPDQISGIEVKLSMNRFGRIMDDTIQLTLAGSLIGENKTDMSLDPIKVYGGATEMWQTNVSKAYISDPTFGVVLRFKSHPRWPHRSSALIDAVELRIH
jgi:hypothetical protein